MFFNKMFLVSALLSLATPSVSQTAAETIPHQVAASLWSLVPPKGDNLSIVTTQKDPVFSYKTARWNNPLPFSVKNNSTSAVVEYAVNAVVVLGDPSNNSKGFVDCIMVNVTRQDTTQVLLLDNGMDDTVDSASRRMNDPQAEDGFRVFEIPIDGFQAVYSAAIQCVLVDLLIHPLRKAN